MRLVEISPLAVAKDDAAELIVITLGVSPSPPPPPGAAQVSTPNPLVESTYPLVPPVMVMLLNEPKLVVPDTVSDVNVPTEVILV